MLSAKEDVWVKMLIISIKYLGLVMLLKTTKYVFYVVVYTTLLDVKLLI